MGFVDAIKSGFNNYVNFSGRSSRSEYWYWTLFVVLVSIVANIVDYAFFKGSRVAPVGAIWSLATLLPGMGVSVRRLHDVNRSGWWLLIGLTLIGALFPLLYWVCKESDAGDNRFGKNPLLLPKA